jgi:hypothetical protein
LAHRFDWDKANRAVRVRDHGHAPANGPKSTRPRKARKPSAHVQIRATFRRLSASEKIRQAPGVLRRLADMLNGARQRARNAPPGFPAAAAVGRIQDVISYVSNECAQAARRPATVIRRHPAAQESSEGPLNAPPDPAELGTAALRRNVRKSIFRTHRPKPRPRPESVVEIVVKRKPRREP